MEEAEKTFYQKIKTIRVLTKEEERNLIKKAKNKDEKAIETLIYHNLRLVAKIAASYEQKIKIDFDDLFQTGIFGLYKAIEYFDLTLDYKFSTYATNLIKKSIQNMLETTSRTIHLPIAKERQLRKIKNYIEEFYMVNGYYPTINQISQNLHIEESIITILYNHFYLPVSLDFEDLTLEENNKGKIIHILTDEKENIEDEVIQKILVLELLEQMENMSERNKTILKLRYGFDGTNYKTREEVAKIFNLTSERVRQIEERCLKILRQLLEEQPSIKSKKLSRKKCESGEQNG